MHDSEAEMKPALDLQAFAKAERLTVPAQTKLTPSEHARLLEIRDELHSQGLTEVTVSSLLRTFAVSGIRVFEDELGFER